MNAKVYKTNKATFEVRGNRIRKKYFKTGNIKNEYRLLKIIEEKFKPVTIQGWVYRPINIYPSDDKQVIEMEYIDAKTLRESFREQNESAYYKHMGLWLGLLHKFSFNKASKKVLNFEDYSDTNFLLDVDNKQALAIDPGDYERIKCHPSVSILTGSFSIQRSVLKESKNYFKVIKSVIFFMKGYLEAREIEQLPKLNPGIKQLSKRKKVLWYRRRGKRLPLAKKFIRSIEILVLALLLKLISKFVLKKRA